MSEERVTKKVYNNTGDKIETFVENLDSVEITTNAKDKPVPKVKCYWNSLDDAVKDVAQAYDNLRIRLGLEE